MIGPDGTCKVCGRAAQNWGDERKRGLIEPPDEPADADALAAGADDGDADDEDEDEDLDADDDLDADEAHDEGEEEDDGEDDLHDAHDVAPLAASASASLPAAPVDWGTRRLCPDGSCIGLIGADGRCKVCGRAATGGPVTGGPTNGEAASGEVAPAGFTIVTTDAAVATTDDAVQTTASTVKTGEPDASDPAAHASADDDPDSKASGR